METAQRHRRKSVLGALTKVSLWAEIGAESSADVCAEKIGPSFSAPETQRSSIQAGKSARFSVVFPRYSANRPDILVEIENAHEKSVAGGNISSIGTLIALQLNQRQPDVTNQPDPRMSRVCAAMVP